MNVETFSTVDFTGRYGSQQWIGDTTKSVIVGSIGDLRNYLTSNGFVNPYTTFSLGRDPKNEFVKDTSDYVDTAIEGIKGSVDDPLDITDHVGEFADELNLTDKLRSYAPDAIRKLGATLPLVGREHARIHQLSDGRYAAEIHTDPGITNYVDGGQLWDGNLLTLFEGAGKAIKYHYVDPVVKSYKAKAGNFISSLIGSGDSSVPVSEPGNTIKLPNSGIGDDQLRMAA